jgi:hypothetical protein
MLKKILTASIAVVFATVAANSFADVVTFSSMSRAVAAGEVGSAAGGGAAPADGKVNMFFVTTDTDILSVGNVKITLPNGVTLYNNTFGDGGNAEPGNSALIPTFPSLGVDSWVTTPGTTSRLGADLPGDGTTTFGDLTNDGPQSNFKFAQLTMGALPQGQKGTFTGVVSIASTVTPGSSVDVPFNFTIGVPEPATLGLAGMSIVGLLAASRRRMA